MMKGKLFPQSTFFSNIIINVVQVKLPDKLNFIFFCKEH